MGTTTGKLVNGCTKNGDLVSRESDVRFAITAKGNLQPFKTENYPLTQFVLHLLKVNL